MRLNSFNSTIPEILPVVPTMDVVVFPNQVIPLLVVDDKIINGINKSLEEDPKLILLLGSKKQSDDYSGPIGTKDLYTVGTVALIMRFVKVAEGGIKILVQGIAKAKITQFITQDLVLKAHIEPISLNYDPNDPQIFAQIKNIKDVAEKISVAGTIFSPDFYIILSKMNDPEKIADFILSHLNLRVDQAQELLEAPTQQDFLQGLYLQLDKELEVSKLQENIKTDARESMNKAQKEFYLREQLKAIQRELGDDDSGDVQKMRDKATQLALPEEAKVEVFRQLNRLEKTAAESMEASVIRNHLDWILAMPWGKETEDNLDLKRAKEILDADHHGLDEIKERILDYISIRKLKTDTHAPILCFAGPPGTGKTSLGKSIAECLGRNHFRISLGGVQEEAELRGHRRTYVGAMPGRFINGIRKAGSMNALIVIDEIDKLGSNFRGDPSAALLEILDPQQNKSFYDNFLGIPFDLSKIIFVATANNVDALSEPLRDRMEIISLSGYSLEEKVEIAQKHIIKKALQSTGLDFYDIDLSPALIQDVIANYTREAGVRELERLIKKLCSKIARSLVENNKLIKINSQNLESLIGPRKFIDTDTYSQNDIGISNGLAWTAYGGEIIRIEAVLMIGKGRLILTGSLGNVMRESAQAALSYARAHSEEFGIHPNRFTHYDLHIHIPGGAIPKDGPSAGVTLLSSMLSALTERPINSEYAMTGELNLRGNVMAIGGVKEKILAAKRNKVPHVILPFKNKNDLIGADDIANGIDIIWVNHATEVLNHVLMPKK